MYKTFLTHGCTVNCIPKVVAEGGVKTADQNNSKERGTFVTKPTFQNASCGNIHSTILFSLVHFKDHMLENVQIGVLCLTNSFSSVTVNWLLMHFVAFVKPNTTSSVSIVVDQHTSHNY